MNVLLQLCSGDTISIRFIYDLISIVVVENTFQTFIPKELQCSLTGWISVTFKY